MTVSQLLVHKGHDVFTVNSSQTVYQALQILAEKNIGALVVLEEKKPVGMFSERDYARRVMLKGASSLETRVKEVMSYHLVSVGPDTGIESALGVMSRKRIRHLPVIAEGKLVGLVSIGDLVEALLHQKDREIARLKRTAPSTTPD
ncbi:MAG: CBS domain-containing protein [Geothermobacteraceae bacterium]